MRRRSSVTDQTLARHTAAAASGTTVRSVLLALRTAGGAAQLATIAAHFVRAGTSEPVVPNWVDGSDQGPKSADQVAVVNEINSEPAKTMLRRCYTLVAYAGTFGEPHKECKRLPIFASGQSDVKSVTDPERSCDEYPFYSSVQAGQFAIPAPSLEAVNGVENSRQGTLCGSFLRVCSVEYKPVGERQFLAIPLPPTATPLPTLALCNGS